MELEKKLDQIIFLLKKIETTLQRKSDQIDFEKSPIQIDKRHTPTPSQLRDQRVVRMVNQSDRLSFLKECKKNIYAIIKIKKKQSDFELMFEPQSLKWFNTNFKKPNSPFYIRLKNETKEFGCSVTKEGKMLIEKLIRQIDLK